jgi:hypothetical protein
MQYNDFIKLTEKRTPVEKLSGIHLALWYVFKDNWEMAHKTTQKLNTQTACWFHAYLHRIEGDPGNAEYWYGRANMEPNSIPLETELNDIINSVFI